MLLVVNVNRSVSLCTSFLTWSFLFDVLLRLYGQFPLCGNCHSKSEVAGMR